MLKQGIYESKRKLQVLLPEAVRCSFIVVLK